MADRGKKLQERLEEVSLSANEEAEIIESQTIKTVRDTIVGIIPMGEAIGTILNWNDEVNSEIENAKRNLLIEKYFDKSDENEKSIEQIKALITNPYGSTLFNKILQILDASPPDEKLIGHLSAALKYISDNDFKKLFDEHKFALSQIEKLTPQGLTVLSDFKNWPIFFMNGYSSNGGKITSDWIMDFTKAYAAHKKISDNEIINRILHSVNELVSSRLIEAWLTQDDDKHAGVIPSDIGKFIIPYIQS